MEDQFFQYVEIDNPYLPKAIELIRSDITGISGIYPMLVFKNAHLDDSRRIMMREEHQQFESNRAMSIIKNVCSALDALKEKGILHGNLSSESVTISKNYEVMLWDFLLFGQSEAASLDKITPLAQKYMAPELFDGAEITITSDIYAVACLLHEYLEGNTPFLGANQEEQHVNDSILGLNLISAKLNKLILKSLLKSAGQRQQNYQVLIKALNKMIKVKALGGVKSKASGSKIVPILIILFLLASLGGGAYFYMNMMGGPSSKKKTIMKRLSSKKSKRKRRVKRGSKGSKSKVVVEKVEDKKLALLDGMVAFNNPKFTMGSDFGEDDAQPAHEVILSPYYIDQFEITNEQYKNFVVKKKADPPKNPKKRFNLWKGNTFNKKIGSQPVVNVTWQQANDYCVFVGKRLPTEAEWEFAARGAEGRQYPWGNIEPDPSVAQFDGEWAKSNTLYEVDFFDEGKTPEGVYNLLGGVREWVSDWYAMDYYEDADEKDPKGPEDGEKKVQRGGSWEDTPEFSIFRETSAPNSAQEGTGFRC
ncbi:SUMF1/EgtB/PvdO family nonheme iron enzyme, partial [bacterium]|nr:SUMF1/EgtB/PvdO family nonheme iron enzyme [bacterium]